MDALDSRTVTRYVTAYGGDMMPTVNRQVTHIITGRSHIDQQLRDYIRVAASNVAVVGTSWVETSLKNKRIDYSQHLQIKEAIVFKSKRVYLHFIPDPSWKRPDQFTRSSGWHSTTFSFYFVAFVPVCVHCVV
jgi:hypothetical protein